MKDWAKKSFVTKHFREVVLRIYPGLNHSESYRKFFAVLLFSVHRDKESNEVIIPSDVLADIEQRENDYLNNNYNALPFLKRFQSEVMSAESFTWSGWSKDKKKARTAKVVWKVELLEALKEEIPSKKRKDIAKVLFSTGESYSSAKKKIEYDTRPNESLQIICETEPAAKELLKYLDDRSFRIYTAKFYENVDEAVSIIQNDPSPASRDYNLRVLKDIEKITKPIYSPSKKSKTDRIFTGSWMLLSRRYREILTKGWVSYDLKYSQVAICAKLWGIKTVQDFLFSNGNVWSEIFNSLGIDYGLRDVERETFENIKAPLKDALYSLIYGKRLYDIARELNDNAVLRQYCRSSPDSLLENRIIKALYSAREKQKKVIVNNQQIVTCFGRTLPLTFETPRKSNVKSLMAIQAQALELKLLLPIIKLAKTTTDFQVTLWAHDGFYVWYKDASKESTWEPRIIDAIMREINKHEVFTKLERQ